MCLGTPLHIAHCLPLLKESIRNLFYVREYHILHVLHLNTHAGVDKVLGRADGGYVHRQTEAGFTRYIGSFFVGDAYVVGAGGELGASFRVPVRVRSTARFDMTNLLLLIFYQKKKGTSGFSVLLGVQFREPQFE